jgi:hypothetical protein
METSTLVVSTSNALSLSASTHFLSFFSSTHCNYSLWQKVLTKTFWVCPRVIWPKAESIWLKGWKAESHNNNNNNNNNNKIWLKVFYWAERLKGWKSSAESFSIWLKGWKPFVWKWKLAKQFLSRHAYETRFNDITIFKKISRLPTVQYLTILLCTCTPIVVLYFVSNES